MALEGKMKKLSNFTWVGYIIGIAFALFSAVRYFWIWPDTDKALVYVGLGIIVCAIAWIYNRLLSHSNTIEAMEEYLADGGIK